MRSLITFVTPLLFSIAAFSQSSYTLPETWDKDFQITFTFGGSMDGSNTNLTYTYDSCVYIWNVGMTAPKKIEFRLSEKDRTAILAKMRELKIGNMSSKIAIAPVHDGWSRLLCVGTHCIHAGTSAKMSERDKEIFSAAESFLISFATGRDKK